MKTKSSAIWVLMCVAALGVGAVAAYVVKTPSLRPKVAPDVPIQAPRTLRPPTNHAAQTPKSLSSIIVFVPSMGVDGISFTRQVAQVPEGEDQKVVAVNEFLKASQIAPSDAGALRIDVQPGGLAVIVFNKAFEQTYGTFDEKKMLDGLAATMGQFADVDQISLVVDGKQLTTLGSADLTAPIQVIRPDAVPTQPVPANASGEQPPVKP
ncbi:MAG: GerMN domain-containing protein [Fimbriimonadaceae bacterium]